MCIDYRKLNEKTIKDAYPIPRIDDSLDAIGGSRVFSVFVLKSAYNQVRINPEDQHKTAFSSPWGLFKFKKMSFGFDNAPANFQLFMGNIFREEMFKFVVVYLDDILLFSKNEEDHWKHIRIVLDKLRDTGIKLNRKKCKVF